MVLFFLTSRKNAVGPKGQVFEASHEEAQVSSGLPKGRVMRPGSFHTKSLETVATRVVTSPSRVSALVQVYMYV